MNNEVEAWLLKTNSSINILIEMLIAKAKVSDWQYLKYGNAIEMWCHVVKVITKVEDDVQKHIRLDSTFYP